MDDASAKQRQHRLDKKLHKAASHSDAAMAVQAIAEGAHPASTDDLGMHALMRAALSGHGPTCQAIARAAPELASIPHIEHPHLAIHTACAASDPGAAIALASASDLRALEGAGKPPMVVAVDRAGRRRAPQTLAIVDAISAELEARGELLEALVQLATCVGLRHAPSGPTEDPRNAEELTAGLRQRFETARERFELSHAANPGRPGLGAPRV